MLWQEIQSAKKKCEKCCADVPASRESDFVGNEYGKECSEKKGKMMGQKPANDDRKGKAEL